MTLTNSQLETIIETLKTVHPAMADSLKVYQQSVTDRSNVHYRLVVEYGHNKKESD